MENISWKILFFVITSLCTSEKGLQIRTSHFKVLLPALISPLFSWRSQGMACTSRHTPSIPGQASQLLVWVPGEHPGGMGSFAFSLLEQHPAEVKMMRRELKGSSLCSLLLRQSCRPTPGTALPLDPSGWFLGVYQGLWGLGGGGVLARRR